LFCGVYRGFRLFSKLKKTGLIIRECSILSKAPPFFMPNSDEKNSSGRVVKNPISVAYENFSICTNDDTLFDVFVGYESVFVPAF
jgi:hypothetical protein